MKPVQYLQKCWQGSVGAGCQWVAWQWASILAIAMAPEYNIQQALIASGLIFLSESIITWLRLAPTGNDNPAALPGGGHRDEVNSDAAEAQQTLSVTQQSSSACSTISSILPNALAGIAFFHIDINTARASHNSLVARCAAVAVGDAGVHFSSTVTLGRCHQNQLNVGLARWAALDAGINALAYTLAEHLAALLADHQNIEDSAQRNGIASACIFCFTIIVSKIVSSIQPAEQRSAMPSARNEV